MSPTERTLMRSANVLLSSVVVAIASREVHAEDICDCATLPHLIWTTPMDGRTGVPRNAVVRAIFHSAPMEYLELGLECAGVEVQLVDRSDERNDYQQLLSARPEADLEANAACSLLLGDEPIASFVTSDRVDDTDPEWDGTLDESRPKAEGITCPGWADVVGIDPSGHSDDTTPDNDLLFTLEPDDADTPAAVWGFDGALAVINGERCVNMEPGATAGATYSFMIRAYDEAGNATEAFPITVRDCGCATGTGGSVWPWILGAVLVRRRSISAGPSRGAWPRASAPPRVRPCSPCPLP
jgi:hypothetical protein